MQSPRSVVAGFASVPLETSSKLAHVELASRSSGGGNVVVLYVLELEIVV